MHTLSDIPSARLPHREASYPGFCQSLRDQPYLRSLAGAFGPLEDDQPAAGHNAQESVMIGLAAPFFMPSMIH